jgi:hypothetical protein
MIGFEVAPVGSADALSSTSKSVPVVVMPATEVGVKVVS